MRGMTQRRKGHTSGTRAGFLPSANHRRFILAAAAGLSLSATWSARAATSTVTDAATSDWTAKTWVGGDPTLTGGVNGPIGSLKGGGTILITSAQAAGGLIVGDGTNYNVNMTAGTLNLLSGPPGVVTGLVLGNGAGVGNFTLSTPAANAVITPFTQVNAGSSFTIGGANVSLGATPIINNGSVTYAHTNAGGIFNAIMGPGNVTFSNPGTVNDAWTQTQGGIPLTYTGTTTINMTGGGGVIDNGTPLGLSFFIQGGQDLPKTSIVNILSGNVQQRNASSRVAGLTGTGNWNANSGNRDVEINVLGGSVSYGGAIQDSPQFATVRQAVTKLGPGTQILTGDNTYSNGTTVGGGVLQVGNGVSGTILNGADLTLAGGAGTLDIHEVAGSIQQIGNVNVNSGGDGTIQSTYGGTGNTELRLATITRNSGGAINYVVAGGTLTGVAPTNKIIINAAPAFGTLLDQGAFFGGSNYAAYDTNGYLRAYSYASDANGVTTSGTPIATGSANNVLMTGAVTAQPTAAINTLNISGNNNLTLAAGASLTVNGILKGGNTAGGATISGGAGIQSASGDLVVRTDGVNDALTISSPILAATTGLTKSGAGTLTLAGANAYTGTTAIGGGTLQVGSGGAVAGILGTGPIVNNATLSVNHSDALSLSALTGRGNLIKSGGGTLTLTGTSNFAGTTTINAGTLEVSGTGQYSGSENIVNNGTLSYVGRTGLTVVLNAISGSGNVLFANSPTNPDNYFSLQNTNTYTGTTTVNLNGTTALGKMLFLENFFKGYLVAGTSPTSPVNIISGDVMQRDVSATVGGLSGAGTWRADNARNGTPKSLTLNVVTGSQSYSGTLLNNLTVIKTGAGTQSLAAANSYTGGTVVSVGKLVAADANAINSARPLTISNGATFQAQPSLATAVDVSSLSMTATGATGGTLDLTKNSLVVRNANAAAATASNTAVNGLVSNAFHNFAWDQPGITSTSVQADIANEIPTALGILLNNDGDGNALFYGDGGASGLPQFKGRSVDANSVLVKYTLLGDGDLNGVVNTVDFGLFQAGYSHQSPYVGFAFGDYDYNGVINSVDFGLFQAGYQYSGSHPTPLMVAFAQENNLSLEPAAVPEPATLSLLALGVAGLGMRQRRHRVTA